MYLQKWTVISVLSESQKYGLCVRCCCSRFINIDMKISEIESPKTPDQLRIDQLKATSDRASNAVKQERQRQKIQKAQKALQTLRAPSSATLKPIKPV